MFDFKTLWQKRNEITILPIKGLLCLLVVGVSLYILIAINAGSVEYKAYHFGHEQGAVTALSAIFLAMACGLAGTSFFVDKRPVKSKRTFWLMTSGVLGFLALDELLQFHEKLGRWMMTTSLGEPASFRNWNDVIVIGYGVVGLLVLFVFLSEILGYPRFFEIICLAFVCFCLHTFVDSVSEPKTTVSVIVEESFKLFCSSFLMFAMFVGLLGVIGRDYQKKA